MRSTSPPPSRTSNSDGPTPPLAFAGSASPPAGRKGWCERDIAAVTRLAAADVWSILHAPPPAPPVPRVKAPPPPKELPEWSPLRGDEYRDERAIAGTELPAIAAVDQAVTEPVTARVVPVASAEDWGSPHRSSIPGGRLADDDDQAEADVSLPETSPMPSCSKPRPRRWKEPGKGSRRDDDAYRDD